MIPPWKIFGRLGNSLFQYAFMYSYARDHGLDFYFQDEYFFREHAEAVRTLFSADIPAPTNRVAIHVRRGDYVNNSFYVDLTKTDYYEKAIKQFPHDKFIVFSDDIPWCEEKWGKDPRFEFSYGNELEDLNLMASCKAHIVANSSFSWWGAYLHPIYPDNRVLCPSRYYTDGVERTVFPEHWERINI